MRWLAVDPGDKYIGVAVSDATGLIARPLVTLRHSSYAESAARIVALAAEHNVTGVIVGLPLAEEGEVGPQARKAGRLAEAIRARTTLTVLLHDESLSSRTAQALKRAARGKKRPAARAASDHAAAAAVILQDYLDAHPTKAPPS
jgi:putative Holliday junction resolvase